jgi:thiol-disulfide isomerase/thioredoxin
MKRSFVLIGVIAVLFTAIGIYFGVKQYEPAAAEPAVVSQFFAQSMPDIKGQPQALEQWRGKPLVVNFWATWCAPCVEEMPELTQLQSDLSESKVQILGIGIDSPSNIVEFSQKHKIGYPLYVAGMSGTELSRQFGNKAGGLPFTVLIDSKGLISKTYLGRLKMAELRQDIAELE